MEPRNMPHDFRCEDGVLDDLYNGKHDKYHEHDNPEILSCVSCLHNSQQDSRYKAYQLQIRHHVEQSDEHAQTHSNGEIDDQEADTEQDAYAKGDKCLTSEILIHTHLYIAD